MYPENILILTALNTEARALKRALGDRACQFFTVGIGVTRLPSADDVTDVSLILVCGVAGALEPGLKIGEVILDDPNRRIADDPRFRRGGILTAAGIISTPAQKAMLFADTGCLAVELEQKIIRETFRLVKVPVVGVRAISDTADQVLEPAVLGLVNDVGRPRVFRIAWLLTRRPSMLSYLRELNRSTKVALNQLGEAVAVIVDTLTRTEKD